ncbi:urease subunit beta [Kribbella sp. NPDC056951]|uniref:urease subunit beta n=1 Tax=Kribbella sp. NPDC056951 TaxID=3345978 RepID=UPI00362638F6
MTEPSRLSQEEQGTHTAAVAPADAPGAIRVRPGTIVLNADRTPDERLLLVIVNTGDRPIQIGSHLHLPDANTALAFDRDVAAGYRLDIPSGTSQRFEPGASREVNLVALKGARRVPGIQVKRDA